MPLDSKQPRAQLLLNIDPWTMKGRGQAGSAMRTRVPDVLVYSWHGKRSRRVLQQGLGAHQARTSLAGLLGRGHSQAQTRAVSAARCGHLRAGRAD